MTANFNSFEEQYPEHVPVLRDEVLTALNLTGADCVVDATYGRGGHSRAIMAKLSSQGRLIVIDRDHSAIEAATREWGDDDRVDVVHGPFSDIGQILDSRGLLGQVTGMLFDFGVSSPQLDDSERGFSFMQDGPLDMRMDQNSGISAAQWLQQTEEADRLLCLKNMERRDLQNALPEKIKEQLNEGEISTTGELAKLVAQAVPKKEIGKHPATRTFQAIRIAVNDELGEIKSALSQVLEATCPGGRIVIISFHSLEDRLVKRFFKEQSKGDPYPPDMPVTQDMLKPRVELVGKRIMAGDNEVRLNRRSRSAVMRVAQKVY